MKTKTCCFTGHRTILIIKKVKIQKRLAEEIEHLIQQGVVYFSAGGALGFDTMAALTVLELKKTYTQIRLILVLPCKKQTKCWKEKDIALYNDILEQADKVVYTAERYH